MCGINGFNFGDEALVKRMNAAIRHRGPDGSGTFSDGSVTLGHVRLSVLDLSPRASQPMRYGNVVGVYNGEIYNFRQIRKELESRGYAFRTRSDTEVLLASYLEWGEKCVRRFNGMWAFAIYDPDEGRVFLSRDRLGVKPLYYYHDGKIFAFSSELKGLVAFGIPKAVCERSLKLYFSLGFIPSPYSIFEKVCKLEPATNLTFYLDSGRLEKERFWELPEYAPVKDFRALKKEFYRIFESAVRLRTVSDVDIGVLLSGGLDSGAVYSFLSRIKPGVKTFSIGFRDRRLDESRLIKRMSPRGRISFFSSKDFSKSLSEISEMLDEPFADFSIFPTYSLCRFARRWIKVALSGDGGDEVFGGYPHYVKVNILRLLARVPGPFLKLLDGKAGKISGRFKKGEYLSYYFSDENKFFPGECREWMEDRFSVAMKKAGSNPVEAFRIMDMLYLSLPDNYLTKVDRASMFTSLEVRSPFLDYRLAEFSQKVPTELKVGFLSGKIFLRKVLKLPKEILKAKKSGFVPPFWNWFRPGKVKRMSAEAGDVLPEDVLEFYKRKVFSVRTPMKAIYLGRMGMFSIWKRRWLG